MASESFASIGAIGGVNGNVTPTSCPTARGTEPATAASNAHLTMDAHGASSTRSVEGAIMQTRWFGAAIGGATIGLLAAGAASTPVQTGTQDMSVSVTVVFALS
jgi:uncharacterized protein YggE